jgi:hypothetical protein
MIDDWFPDEHLFSISKQTPWFFDIENYLTIGKFPQHFLYRERCKIVRKSSFYTWVANYLFKLFPDQILRICIREDEVHDILHACHDEPCGGHYAAKRTTYKILQVGYYWPTLHRDAQQYTSHCDECQRMGKPTRRNEIPLQPQVSLEPFDKWGMDFIGPIDPPSGKKKHILVCTDYLTKWVEVRAMKDAIESNVACIPPRMHILKVWLSKGDSHGSRPSIYIKTH